MNQVGKEKNRGSKQLHAYRANVRATSQAGVGKHAAASHRDACVCVLGGGVAGRMIDLKVGRSRSEKNKQR